VSAVDGVNAAGQTAPAQNGFPDAVAGSAASSKIGKAEERSFSFGDFIDVINPLQHIPGIAEIYRSITNDQISDDARKTGNVIYGFALGGPVGVGAMMAYNAVGDRLNGGSVEEPPVSVAAAGAESVPASPEAGTVPVPDLKPAGTPAARPEGPDDRADLMGQAVAAAGDTPGVPLNLVELITGSKAPEDSKTAKASSSIGIGATEASSVSYSGDKTGDSSDEPFLPDTNDLDRVATHQANRLPLDVLKALQERHAQRTASERS